MEQVLLHSHKDLCAWLMDQDLGARLPATLPEDYPCLMVVFEDVTQGSVVTYIRAFHYVYPAAFEQEDSSC